MSDLLDRLARERLAASLDAHATALRVHSRVTAIDALSRREQCECGCTSPVTWRFPWGVPITRTATCDDHLFLMRRDVTDEAIAKVRAIAGDNADLVHADQLCIEVQDAEQIRFLVRVAKGIVE